MIDVVCAVIKKDKKILCVQRSEKMTMPLKWEFPGGKLEQGEQPEEALKRELYEELNVRVKVIRALPKVEHSYTESLTICLLPFLVNLEEGVLQLNEHKQFTWLRVSELGALDWAAADWPIVHYLQENR